MFGFAVSVPSGKSLSVEVAMLVAGSLVLGLVLLVFGGDLLVKGASRLALGLGIAPVVIGLTVVAFGTSAPELVVSVKAALGGDADIALGNVVGSNILNVLLILGASALITPLVVHRTLLVSDVPVMIGASILCYFVAADGVISRIEGGFLFVALIAYISRTVLKSRAENAVHEETVDPLAEIDVSGPPAPLMNIGFIVLGLVVLVVGAQSFLWGSIEIARIVGLSELVIGLTIVSVGTSLPEIATSIIAALRGDRDIAIGNVVGSNIFGSSDF